MSVELGAKDDERCQIVAEHLLTASDFLREASAGGGRVLVHCHAGINRSAAIVVACLMHLHEMDALTAVLKVWTARPVILQNRAFVEQLATLQLRLLELAPSRWHSRRDLGGIQSVEEASVDAAAAPTAAAVLGRTEACAKGTTVHTRAPKAQGR